MKRSTRAVIVACIYSKIAILFLLSRLFFTIRPTEYNIDITANYNSYAPYS